MQNEMGCDRQSVRDWQTLFLANDIGRVEAMNILHKILKKSHGGEGQKVRHPPAFVIAAVKKAWHVARPDPYRDDDDAAVDPNERL